MIKTIEPNIILAIAAMIGSLFYHVAGYLDARNDNPDVKYKYTYFTQTLITICIVAGMYQTSQIELTFFTVILAFITGLGGNAGTSTILRRKVKQ